MQVLHVDAILTLVRCGGNGTGTWPLLAMNAEQTTPCMTIFIFRSFTGMKGAVEMLIQSPSCSSCMSAVPEVLLSAKSSVLIVGRSALELM